MIKKNGESPAQNEAGVSTDHSVHQWRRNNAGRVDSDAIQQKDCGYKRPDSEPSQNAFLLLLQFPVTLLACQETKILILRIGVLFVRESKEDGEEQRYDTRDE